MLKERDTNIVAFFPPKIKITLNLIYFLFFGEEKSCEF